MSLPVFSLPTRSAAVLTLLLGLQQSASALIFTEGADTGHLIGTAINVGGGINQINGVLNGTPIVSTSGDIDVYQLNLPNGIFSASVTTTSHEAAGAGADLDTALVLFNSAGIGLFADDDSAGAFHPKITTGALSAGTYYLAIFPVLNYTSPTSASGNIWTKITFLSNGAPDGPGAGSGWTGWGDVNSPAVDNGTYTIQFNVATVAPVPVPGTVWLFGSALAGLVGFNKRRS